MYLMLKLMGFMFLLTKHGKKGKAFVDCMLSATESMIGAETCKW